MSLSPGHLVGPLGPAESQVTDGHKGTMVRSSEQVAKPQRLQEKLPGMQHFLQLKVIEHSQLNLEKRIHLPNTLAQWCTSPSTSVLAYLFTSELSTKC